MDCQRCGQKKSSLTSSQRLKMNIIYHVKDDKVKIHMLNLVRLVNIEAFDRGNDFASHRRKNYE